MKYLIAIGIFGIGLILIYLSRKEKSKDVHTTGFPGFTIRALMYFLLLKPLNKLGLVSNKALGGEETNKIRIVKNILLLFVLLVLLIGIVLTVINQ